VKGRQAMRLIILTIALFIFISPAYSESPDGKAIQCSELRSLPEGRNPDKVFYSNIKVKRNFSFERGAITQYYISANNLSSIKKRQLFYIAKPSTINIYGNKPGVCKTDIDRQTLFMKTCNLYQRCVLTTKKKIVDALSQKGKTIKSKKVKAIKKNKI